MNEKNIKVEENANISNLFGNMDENVKILEKIFYGLRTQKCFYILSNNSIIPASSSSLANGIVIFPLPSGLQLN